MWRLSTLTLSPPTYFFFGVILLALVYRAFFWAPVLPESMQRVEEECRGAPIPVSYPYRGTVEKPHTCKIQCADGIQRYILYSNNLATQCEDLPGCIDFGEDRGVTCKLAYLFSS